MNPVTNAAGEVRDAKTADRDKEDLSSNGMFTPTSSRMSSHEGHGGDQDGAVGKSNHDGPGETNQSMVAHGDGAKPTEKGKSSPSPSATPSYDAEGGKQGKNEPSGEKNENRTVKFDDDNTSNPGPGESNTTASGTPSRKDQGADRGQEGIHRRPASSESLLKAAAGLMSGASAKDNPSPVAQLGATKENLDHTPKAEDSAVKQKESPLEKLGRALECIRTGDVTSKFVGLYLLQSILKNKPELLHDLGIMADFWAIIPGSFLDRLFRATKFKGQERNDIFDRDLTVGLAVGIIHTFAIYLPAPAEGDPKILGRMGGLLAALEMKPSVPDDIRDQILRIFVLYAMTPQGAAVLLEDRARVILIQTASQNKTALDCLHRAFAVKAVDSQSAALLSSLHDTMSRLVETFNHASDPSAHFSCAHGLITLIPKELQDPPSWLGDIARILRDSAATHSEDPERTREECTFLTVALVRTYPLHFPSILFDSQDRAGAEGQKPKPLSWHFAQLRVIDIRATLSSMCDKTAAPAYQSVLNRLTASYEILSAFIAFLVQKSSTAVPFSFDVILQLRDEMSKLCSETMDFLCGRYDGALNTEMNNPDFALKKSKASGRPSSRSDSMPLPTTAMANHPLVVAQIRMLAFWLEEDSSSVKLRDEAGSIMDVLLKLYNTNGELRPPILMIVEQTLGIKNGVDLFCHNNGWEVLMRDLEATLFAPPSYSAAPSSSSSPPERVLEERLDDDAIARAMQIVAILGPVANDGLVGGTSYAQWLELVTLAVRLHDCDGKDKGKAKTKKTEAKTKTDVKGKGKAKTEDKTKGKTDDKGTGKAKGGEAFRHFKQVVMSQAVELARKAKELGVGGGMDEVVGRLVDVTAEAVESLGVS